MMEGAVRKGQWEEDEEDEEDDENDENDENEEGARKRRWFKSWSTSTSTTSTQMIAIAPRFYTIPLPPVHFPSRPSLQSVSNTPARYSTQRACFRSITSCRYYASAGGVTLQADSAEQAAL
jgi:hypothetical protein